MSLHHNPKESSMELHSNAIALERELQGLIGQQPNQSRGNHGAVGNDDAISADLRTRLCSALVDIILLDPDLAREKDCVGRLWRNCFYSRIGFRRNRIFKIQRKADLEEQNLANKDGGQVPNNNPLSLSEVSEKTDAANVNKYTQMVIEMRKALNQFVIEGVEMYIYMIQKLQEKLVNQVEQEVVVLSPSSDSNQAEDIQSKASHPPLPLSTPNHSVDASCANVVVSKQQLSRSSSGPMVDCLRRLYIHLGDLYRYAESNKDAERCYVISSRLGPGLGHPYNQLAVLSQQPRAHVPTKGDKSTTSSKPKQNVPTPQKMITSGHFNHSESANALYWYARSLLASHEPFLTSIANVERLFHENRLQLQQQEELTKESTLTITKDTTSRVFLIHFIELHYHFYLLSKELKQEVQQNRQRKEDGLVMNDLTESNTSPISGKKIEEINALTCRMLSEVLNKNALSDSLLCKLVVINAFSMCYENGYDRNNHVRKLKSRYSQSAAFAFGLCLAERTLTIITKQISQLSQQLSQTSHPQSTTDRSKGSLSGVAKSVQQPMLLPLTRTLLPLLILTEFWFSVITNPSPLTQISIDIDPQALKESQKFWKVITQILNQVTEISRKYQLEKLHEPNLKTNLNKQAQCDVHVDKNAQNPCSTLNNHRRMLFEYEIFRGFGPFQFFLAPLNSDGLLQDNDAAEFINNNNGRSSSQVTEVLSSQRSSSQPSNQCVSTGRKSGEQQNRWKLKRFLALGNQMAQSPEINISIDGTGKFYWVEKNQEKHLQPPIRGGKRKQISSDDPSHANFPKDVIASDNVYNSNNTRSNCSERNSNYNQNDGFNSTSIKDVEHNKNNNESHNTTSILDNRLMDAGRNETETNKVVSDIHGDEHRNENEAKTKSIVYTKRNLSLQEKDLLESPTNQMLLVPGIMSEDASLQPSISVSSSRQESFNVNELDAHVRQGTSSRHQTSPCTTRPILCSSVLKCIPEVTSTIHQSDVAKTYNEVTCETLGKATTPKLAPPPGFGVMDDKKFDNDKSPLIESLLFSVPSSPMKTGITWNGQQSLEENFPVGFLESNFHRTSIPSTFGTDLNVPVMTVADSLSYHDETDFYRTSNPFADPIYQTSKNYSLTSFSNLLDNTSNTVNRESSIVPKSTYPVEHEQHKEYAPSIFGTSPFITSNAFASGSILWGGDQLLDSTLFTSLFTEQSDDKGFNGHFNPQRDTKSFPPSKNPFAA